MCMPMHVGHPWLYKLGTRELVVVNERLHLGFEALSEHPLPVVPAQQR